MQSATMPNVQKAMDVDAELFSSNGNLYNIMPINLSVFVNSASSENIK